MESCLAFSSATLLSWGFFPILETGSFRLSPNWRSKVETWRETCGEEDPCTASKILSSFVAKEVRNTGEGRKGGKMEGRKGSVTHRS